MSKANKLDYELLMQKSLRSVVREALMLVARSGLPGDHHFYISFRTDFPGVDLPAYLHELYPEEIVIVLQYEFWDLEIEEELFFVTLSFNGIHERLTIPFGALVSFADPSVKFGLQFTPIIHPKEISQKRKTKSKTKANLRTPQDEEGFNGAHIIVLDDFREHNN